MGKHDGTSPPVGVNNKAGNTQRTDLRSARKTGEQMNKQRNDKLARDTGGKIPAPKRKK